ncbi:hypothetical protein SNEBB_002345 [Seison nebaliae]|nr:hypothetical protein SNEBB_002345 [Seison nebaliae]
MIEADMFGFALIGLITTPIMSFFALIVLLSWFGISFGIRKKYVKILLSIFEGASGVSTIGKNNRNLMSNLVRESESQYDLEYTKPKSSKLADSTDSGRYSMGEKTNKRHSTKSPNEGDDKRKEIVNGESGSKFEKSSKITPVSLSDEGSDGSENEELVKKIDLAHAIDFCCDGIQSIVDDNVTKRFNAAELRTWNLLTRTNHQYEYIGMGVSFLWFVGFIFRYLILLPFRMVMFIISVSWLIITTTLIGYIPHGRLKQNFFWIVSLTIHRLLARVFTAIITHHNKENRAKSDGICVANHTSPIDVIILSTENCYALVGQKHGGSLGMLQRAMSRATNNIWFERLEAADRQAVANKLREHVTGENNLPILIFPEGTCINNTTVMMFKKGSFEIGCTIYPATIKYDPRFGDPFWNSSKQSMLQHIFAMMTSWAIVVDVYYLPPMQRLSTESAITFANRVKEAIAKEGGFCSIPWDGMVKRVRPKETLKKKIQDDFYASLRRRLIPNGIDDDDEDDECEKRKGSSI